MKKRHKKQELSSPRLKNLQKEMRKIELAEKYLEAEKRKLIKVKEKFRSKIRKEKEVLMLENKIKRVRGRR